MNPPRKTVVLVDDEKAYVDFLTVTLAETLGCAVRSFARPHEALAALPTIDAAVVVTDYCMPEMTGLDFVRAASQLAPEVPFIMISGHATQLEDQDLSAYPQLRRVLAKPFSYRHLAAEIQAQAPGLRDGAGQQELDSAAV